MLGSILAVGALALLGIGGAVVVARILRQQQTDSQAQTGLFLAGLRTLFPSTGMSPTTAAKPEEPPAITNLPPLQWTQALVVLDNLPDPVNPALDAYNRARNEQEKLSSPVGKIYQGLRSALGMVPYVGTVFTVLANLFDVLGPALTGDSRGGFNDLSLLGRQRMTLYRLNPGVLRNTPYESQRFDLLATDPSTSTEERTSEAGKAKYQEKYRRWVRRFLVEEAIKAEMHRIARTNDEAMLPGAVIDLLIEAKQWPPPLEPIPLTKAEWLARRSDPARLYPIDYSKIDLANPTTKAVYDDLQAEFVRDARRFSSYITNILQSRDVLELARTNGSIPRIGSQAAPLKTSGSRWGGL